MQIDFLFQYFNTIATFLNYKIGKFRRDEKKRYIVFPQRRHLNYEDPYRMEYEI